MKLPYRSTCFCTNLKRGAAAVSAFYDRCLQGAGVSISQYFLLVNLSRLGKANITELARAVGLERTTVVRNVKLLEAKKLVEKVQGSGKTIFLTPEGREALSKAVPLWEKAQQKVKEAIGEKECALLLELSEKLESLEESNG